MIGSPGSRAWSSIRAALFIAGLQVGGALLLALAHKQGAIDEETMKRGVGVLIGLGLAAMGNRMPKDMDGPPPQSMAVAAVRQAIHRVGGWAMMLAGLAFAGLWAFAPLEVAVPGCIIAVGTAMAVVLGYIARRGLALHRSSPS